MIRVGCRGLLRPAGARKGGRQASSDTGEDGGPRPAHLGTSMTSGVLIKAAAAEDRARAVAAKGEKFRLGFKEEYLFRTTMERESQRRHASTQSGAGGDTGGSTLAAGELDKFRAMSSSWWDPEGVCKPLHSMNALRVELIRDGMVASERIGREQAESARPLEGLTVLDVGCGGGILCEPLARLGAKVTGLEPTDETRKVAEEHARLDPRLEGAVEYLPHTAEGLAAAHPGRTFDAVVASEVVEHVANQPLFVRACASLCRPGGSLFFTTLNRTRESYLAGVVLAECVLGLLPQGTHDWDRFVEPEELDAWLAEAGCRTRLIHGMFYWPVFDEWSWIPQARVNYALHAVKL